MQRLVDALDLRARLGLGHCAVLRRARLEVRLLAQQARLGLTPDRLQLLLALGRLPLALLRELPLLLERELGLGLLRGVRALLTRLLRLERLRVTRAQLLRELLLRSELCRVRLLARFLLLRAPLGGHLFFLRRFRRGVGARLRSALLLEVAHLLRVLALLVKPLLGRGCVCLALLPRRLRRALDPVALALVLLRLEHAPHLQLLLRRLHRLGVQLAHATLHFFRKRAG